MHADLPLLSVLIWLPILAGVLLLMVGDRSPGFGRWLGLAASVATFVVSALLWRDFDRGVAAMQFVEQQPWIGAFNAWYTLGVDGISMPLIVLTTFITPMVVIAGWSVIEKRPLTGPSPGSPKVASSRTTVAMPHAMPRMVRPVRRRLWTMAP